MRFFPSALTNLNGIEARRGPAPDSGPSVAQVSQPAGSPTSKSAGPAMNREHSMIGASAGMDACDTADWEVCATLATRKLRPNGPAAQAEAWMLNIITALLRCRAQTGTSGSAIVHSGSPITDLFLVRRRTITSRPRPRPTKLRPPGSGTLWPFSVVIRLDWEKV